MSKEKQIEELTADIANMPNSVDCIVAEAEYLYGKGYRKQSEDTVEVVRCKDCEYYDEDGICNLHSEYEDRYTRCYTVHMNGDGFCSCGERKES